MATWHQTRRSPKLDHQNLFSVVISPPHECMAVVRFERLQDAEQYQARCLSHRPHQRGYIYILAPTMT